MAPEYERGIERLERMTQHLNRRALSDKGITKDDKIIWRDLHQWRNEDWAEMLAAIGEVIRCHPKYSTEDQRTKIQRAIDTLQNLWDEHPRILDTKEYKSTAWGALMSMREVFNQCREDRIADPEAAYHERRKALFQ